MTEKSTLEKPTIDPLTKYRTKYRSVLFGAMSIIMMALAIVFYENQFTLSSFSTVLTMDGQAVNDSFVLFLFFFALSIILATTGIIYSVMRRKIIGFILSAIVFAGVCFAMNGSDYTITDMTSKFKIEQL